MIHPAPPPPPCPDSPGGKTCLESPQPEAWTLDCDSSSLVGKRAGEGRGSGRGGCSGGGSLWGGHALRVLRAGPELGSAPSIPLSRGTVPWVALAGPGLADCQGCAGHGARPAPPSHRSAPASSSSHCWRCPPCRHSTPRSKAAPCSRWKRQAPEEEMLSDSGSVK